MTTSPHDTTDAMHFYEPGHGHRLVHDPFKAIIGPRPIGWISSLNLQGGRNLAPYSFFNAFSSNPPIIGFASEGAKDTLHNVRATGEFCWNLATRPLAEAMNTSSAMVPSEVDEFELAGLTPAPSRRVAAPRVAQSPVSFECRVTQVIQLHAADGRAFDNWLTLGEVVGVHIDRALLKEGVYDTAGAQPILRGGGLGDYFEISPAQAFRMQRPRT